VKFQVWPGIIIMSVIFAGLTVYGSLLPAVRPFAVFWFFLIGPGMAFVPLLNIQDSASAVTVGIALSLAIDIAVASVMAYAGWWKPEIGLAVLIVISLIGLAVQEFTSNPSKNHQ